MLIVSRKIVAPHADVVADRIFEPAESEADCLRLQSLVDEYLPKFKVVSGRGRKIGCLDAVIAKEEKELKRKRGVHAEVVWYAVAIQNTLICDS